MAQILNQVYGHEEVIAVLLSALKQQRLASSFIFSGPSGIGKKKTALGLAQALVCEKTNNKSGENLQGACGLCGPCLRVEMGQSESLLLIEPSGQNIKIEQTREALQFLQLRQMGRARILIFDEAHLLNPQAANTLLKSVEEPPAHTHFVFITANPAALLATIRSRSQVVRFQPLSIENLKKVLKTRATEAEAWALRSAQGRVDQLLQFSDLEGPWSALRLASLRFLSQSLSGATELENLKDLLKDKASALFTLQIWLGVFRDWVLTSNHSSEKALNLDQKELLEWGQRITAPWIFFLTQKVLQVEQDVLGNIDRHLAFENFCYLLKKAALQGPVPTELD
jgi:DNA polymerase-3 subunit delta'